MATTSHVSRRSLFTASAAAVAGSALAAFPLVAGAVPASQPDAALIVKGKEFRLVFCEFLGALQAGDDDLANGIGDEVADLVNEIMDLPAATLEGLGVKAMVACAQSGAEQPDYSLSTTFEECFDRLRQAEGLSEGVVALSIARDLLRLIPAMAAPFEPVTPREEI